VVLLISIFSSMFFLRGAFDLPINYPLLTLFGITASVNGAAAWVLVRVRDIRRLTSRSHASRPYGYG
jgi:hypothetical protein